MKLGIGTKITLITITAIIISSVFLGCYFVDHETKAMYAGLEKLGNSLVSNLAISSEWDVLTGDNAAIQKTLVKLFNYEKEIVSAQIQDEDGTILGRMQRAGALASREYSGPITTQVLSSSEEEAGAVSGRKTNEKVIGTVNLRVSLEDMTKKTARLKLIGTLVVFTVILICGLAIYWEIKLFIRKPLARLMAGINKIGGGDLSYRVNIRRQDEIGDVARAFDKMAEDLMKTTMSRDYVGRLFSSMTESLFVVSLDGVIQTVNQAACALLGASENELVGRHCAFCEQDILDELAANGTMVNHEILFHRSDGRDIPVLFSGVVIKNEKGIVEFFVCTVTDITELKLVQEALAAETERLDTTLRSIGDGVVAVDIKERVVLINKMAERIVGWPQQEALGRPIGEIFRIKGETVCGGRDSSLDAVIKQGDILEHKSRIILTKEGSERLILDSIAPIGDKAGGISGAVIVFHDITEKQKMEDFLKIQKLESLSLFAGGIAHDFNNILTAILGNISLTKLNISPESASYAALLDAELAAMRAKDLTHQLLAFAKGGSPIKEVCSLSLLIEETIGFVLSGSNVRCEFDLDRDLWPVEIDTSQISQAIQNLAINASQAMPDGGAITIKAQNLLIDAASGLPLKSGRYVKISLKDSGVGIPAQYLRKIFDPYFTTKQKGSGLGLAATYSIIKRHDGHIDVESEPGRGATFYIYLPASDKPLPQGKDRGTAIHKGKGKILLMDDEEIVLHTAARIIESLGYEVDMAVDGNAALEKFMHAKGSGRPFDAVILDLTVPGGTGGLETIGRLRQITADVKAIVSSGYSDDPVMSHYHDYGFSGFIAKPYKAEEMSQVLHNLLNR